MDFDELKKMAVRTSVVPTIDDMLDRAHEGKRQRMKQEEQEFLAKSAEEQDREIGKNMPFSEMLAGLKTSIHNIYPDSTVVLMGLKPMNDDTTNVVFEYEGKEEAMWAALNECMLHSEVALKMVNRAILLFCKTANESESEQAVTALQDMIKDLRKRNTPETRVTLLKSEVKRLKKACRFDLMAMKEKELQELEQSIERNKLRQKQRLAALEMARAAKAEKKRKRMQAEKDRNRQQPNFAKMAKQKQQQIKQRQAEKKKKSSSGTDTGVRSCSMFNNVG